jgi:spermidine synthase
MRNGQANQKMLPDIAEGHKFDCIIVEKYDNITLAELLDKENFYVHQYNSFYEGYNMACVPTYDVEFFRRTGNTHVVEWLEKKV